MDPRYGVKAGMSGWGSGTASDLRLEYRFWASPFAKIGAWVLPHIACLKRISSLSFIPPVPYPPLRGTFPSRGRLAIRESTLLKRRRATLVNPSAPPLRHPERSRGIFLALRLASHMSLQGNDALLLLFPTSNIHRSSVCKEDFSTSLEMTIREYRYPHHQPEP